VPPSRKNPLHRLRASKARRQADKQNRERPPKSASRNCAQGSKRVVRFAAGVTLIQFLIVAGLIALILWAVTRG
jgi:hypothetical protein